MNHQDNDKKTEQILAIEDVEAYETPLVLSLGALNTLIKGMSGTSADAFPQSGNQS